MAEGSANKVKISDRDKKLLYVIAGIAILLLAYFLGFQKMMNSKQTYVDENVTLEAEVKTLVDMVTKKASIEENTEKLNMDTEKILVNYPPEIRTQDVIYELDLMEQEIKGLLLETESYTMNQVFFMNGTVTEGEVPQDVATAPAGGEGGAQAAPAAIVGYKSNVSTNYTTNFESLVKIIDFVNNNENRMTINNITVTQGEGSKELTCNMDLNIYAVAGTEKTYTPPSISNVRIGKNSLFAEGND